MNKVLIIVIDGCAPEYLTSDTAPNIYRLCAEKGFVKTVQGAVPTVTNVNHACILSGCWPEETHVVGNYYYERATGASGFIEEKGFMKAPTILQKYKEAGARTALLTVKGKILGVYGEGADLGISVQNPDKILIDRLGLTEPPAVSSLESTAWIMDAAYACIQQEAPEFVYCTTNDYVMHHYGPQEQTAKALIKVIDDCVQKIHMLEPDRQIYITADHGMNRKTTIVNLQYISEEAGFHVVCVPPLKDRYIENHPYQEGGVLYLYLKDSCEDEEYIRFISRHPAVQTVLTSEEAAVRYHLPVGEIGDYVVFAARDCAFGEFEGSLLKTDDVRTHGSLEERLVPLAAINPIVGAGKYEYSKDIAANLLRSTCTWG